MSNQSTNQLINRVIHLADNALILGHRNSEWCGHGPILEQDIAITNISLDLIGQARNFYQYAAALVNQSTNQPGRATEDTLAYLRDASEFKNCLLVELPKGDWAFTVLRQFLFSAYQLYLYQELQNSDDEQIAAIAVKSLKEITYHLRWSSEWVIRLGDGTKESHERIKKAADELWSFTHEFFIPVDFEKQLGNSKSGINIVRIKNNWLEKVNEVFADATLSIPEVNKKHTGGKEGKHTEHLGNILTDLQYMQRTFPNCEW